MKSARFAAGLATLMAVGTTQAHIHISVDTLAGQAGDPIIIKAGYYGSETMYTIDGTGRLLNNGQIAVFPMTIPLTQTDAYRGWAASDGILLTSDFFFSSGRLTGGNFQWELINVSGVDGGATPVFGWGLLSSGRWTPDGLTTGATRLDRSYDSRINGHRHNQLFTIDRNGMFDVTLRAWDSNGRYTDSAPLTIRVNATGAVCRSDFNSDGAVDSDDFFDFLNAFYAGSADFNADGVTDSDDFFDFLNEFYTGC